MKDRYNLQFPEKGQRGREAFWLNLVKERVESESCANLLTPKCVLPSAHTTLCI